ncbi:MAG: M36 family metallopeptidase [Myxococcota bacterium]
MRCNSLARASAMLVGLAAALAPAPAAAQLRAPAFDAYAQALPTQGQQLAPPAGLSVLSRDLRRGAPTLLVAAPGALPPAVGPWSAEGRASELLRALAPTYGLGPRALQTARVKLARRTPSGGHVVVFEQRAQGLPVHGSRMTLLLDAAGALVGAGGALHAAVPTAAPGFALSERQAIAHALADHLGGAVVPGAVAPGVQRRDGYRDFALAPAGRNAGYALEGPVRSRPVLYPLPRRLVPAYYAELWIPDGQGSSELVATVVSAEDGAPLLRRSLTQDETFSYLVYAQPGGHPFGGQPFDGAYGDTTPLDPPVVDSPRPAFTTQDTFLVEGLNTNPAGMGDPWLPDGATETTGNNVDAYADRTAPSGFSAGDLRAQVTQPGVFAHVWDPEADPTANDTQYQAGITNLFYVINWLHDAFYDVGFDEAAGNAQQDNFGRGGEDGDRINAEGFDSGGRNNANMATPADGNSPRMQMFLWDTGSRFVRLDGAFFTSSASNFGPSTYDVTAPSRLVDDGTGSTRDGCEPITNDLSGTIALIDRGGCNFIVKVRNAQAQGAVGVIIMNNRGGGPTTLGGDEDPSVTIPATMVSQGNGGRLADAEGDEVQMRLSAVNNLSGSLDNQIIAHEWGHYIHNRLVRCGNNQCGGMGEGWGDYMALLSFLNEDDVRGEPYPAGSFALSGRTPVYFGVRRVPYSDDPAFNALSFRHISQGEALPTEHPLGGGSANNAQVHNSGEIWASMMFDATWALVDRSREPAAPYDFAEAKRRMMSYVVTGMQLAPENPTYTEQRDGIVLAALENDVEDARVIALAFAGRGAGTCAVSPARFSNDHSGVVEDFELSPSARIESLEFALDGPGTRCDADDVLDVGEDGELRVQLRNFGILPLEAATLHVEVSDPALRLLFDPSGEGNVALSPMARGEARELLLPVRLVGDPADPGAPLEVRASLLNDSLCDTVETTLELAVSADLGLRDDADFEVEPPWFAESSLDGRTTGVWAVVPSEAEPANGVLRALDAPGITDTAVVLPPMEVSATESFVFSFTHRYEFEADFDDEVVYWDGGVIEVSRDGGATWNDVEIPGVLEPGYDGQLSDRADNPLSDRRAFSGTNPSAPEADAVVLDFGSVLAGETVQLRFRVGTDQARGAPGWEIDDLTVSGVTGPSFPAYVGDGSDCAGAPTADPGPPQEVFGGETAVLDGSGSSDPDGDVLTFAWTPLEDAPALDASDAPLASFLAPEVLEATLFAYRLTVSDGVGSDTADTTVNVLVAPPPPADMGPMDEDMGPADMGPMDEDMGMAPLDMEMPPADGGDDMPEMASSGGCGCHVAGSKSPPAGAMAVSLGLFALVVFRRRRLR